MKRALLVCIFSLSLMLTFAAEDISMQAQVDKTKLTTDEVLSYKITISSSKENLPPPSLPSFAGFKVVSQVQSSTISFAHNERKINISSVYLLSPSEAGLLQIQPASIKVSGLTYSTQAFEIEVIQGKVKTIPPSQKHYSETPQVTL